MINDFKDIQSNSWILSMVWETVSKVIQEVSSIDKKFTKKIEILKEGKKTEIKRNENFMKQEKQHSGKPWSGRKNNIREGEKAWRNTTFISVQKKTIKYQDHNFQKHSKTIKKPNLTIHRIKGAVF